MNQTRKNGKKDLILCPILARLAKFGHPNFFFVLSLLDVRYYLKLSLYAISRKTYPNPIKLQKT